MATETKELKMTIYDGGPCVAKMNASLERPAHGSFGEDMSRATAVMFKTQGNTPWGAGFLWACINGMQREDGSGHSWNLEGYIFVDSSSGKTLPFKAYYNSRNRSGKITMELKE